MSIFKTFHADGDLEFYVVDDKLAMKNDFVFNPSNMFSNKLHPYHKRQLDWMQRVLRDGGIELNINTVPTVHDMGGDPDEGEFKAKELKVPDWVKPSKDGLTYYLIQDEEMGRGWAVLMRIDGAGRRKILQQDHRDSIRDYITNGEWVRKFGIDYQREKVESLSGLNYKPE